MRLALCLLAGCLPELGDAVVVQGRHVTVYASPAIPVCERAVAIADRFVEDTATMLGITPPAIDYYLFDGLPHCALAGNANVSCVVNGTVYANVWIHFHELAHAVDDSYPPAVFVEGFAEALSTPSEAARHNGLDRANARLDLETTDFRAGPPDWTYRVAGDFMRYVLERFGGMRYRTFASSLLSLSDELTIRRVFEQVYGVALDDVIASWRAADPASSTLSVPVDLADCHDPIPPTGFETWAVDEVVPDACTSGITTLGTVYDQPTRRYGFEVTTPGLFVVYVAGGTARSTVRSCRDHVVYDHPPAASSMQFTTLPLHPGRHAIDVGEDATAWRIARLGDVSATCDAAPVFTAPTSDSWQLEFRGQPATWIRIATAKQRALMIATTATSPLSVCTGACAPQRCRSITSRAELEPRAGPLYVQLPAAEAELPSVIVSTLDDS